MPPESPLNKAWEASSTRRLIRWFYSWRVWRVILFGAALAGTLIGLYYAEENWRGRRAWNKYSAQLVAQGVQLDLGALVPPEVPAESNFASAPFLVSVFPKRGKDPARWPDLYDKAASHVTKSTNRKAVDSRKGERELTDVFAWQQAFRQARGRETNTFSAAQTNQAARAAAAAEALEALSLYDDVLNELRAAAPRPGARYAVTYNLENPWGILLPHLAAVKSVCTLTAVRGSLQLAKGDPDAACQDVLLLFTLAESLRNEPFLISYLVRIACLNIASQPLWEGLRQHLWTEKHLAEFQRRLEKMDYIESLAQPIAAEQAAGNATFDMFRRSKDAMSLLSALVGDNSVPKLKFNPIPRGWSYFEQVNYHRIFQATVRKGMSLETKVISPEQVEANAQSLQTMLNKPFGGLFHHVYIARLLIPAIGKTHKRAAEGQTLIHQMRLACTLEKYFLSNRKYPERLQDITEPFGGQIPHDIITGSPMSYRKAGDGYVLYSVGWDADDDGGVPGKVRWDEEADWVWRL